MTLAVRVERPDDAAAVRRVNEEAFAATAEADLVERLHRDDEVVVSLVAEDDGEIVGHILFSRLPIVSGDGILNAAALAPMAVRPGWQRSGVGARLVRDGLVACALKDIAAAVVLGHPGYYPRFGFSADAAAQLRSPYSGSDAFMALRLDGRPEALHGEAIYAPAFGDLG